MSAFLHKLPAETRIQIYCCLLSFEHPIYRVTKPRNGLSVRKGVWSMTERSLDVAILHVNQQIHREALPLFYDLNTVVMRHAHLCFSENAMNGLQTDLLLARKIIFKADNAGFTYAMPNKKCLCCRFPKLNESAKFYITLPQMRAVIVQLDGFGYTLCAALHNIGEWLGDVEDARFTAVGRIEANSKAGVKVDFEHRAIALTWQYLAWCVKGPHGLDFDDLAAADMALGHLDVGVACELTELYGVFWQLGNGTLTLDMTSRLSGALDSFHTVWPELKDRDVQSHEFWTNTSEKWVRKR